MVAGGDGKCHAGELDWESLNATRQPNTILRDDPAHGKHTFGAWEMLQHIIIGNMGLRAPFRTNYCESFAPQANCPHSPCKPGALWMARGRKGGLRWVANATGVRNNRSLMVLAEEPFLRRSRGGSAHAAMRSAGGHSRGVNE